MKPLLLLASALLMGCSTPPSETTSDREPARYATPEERVKLAAEARRNFERQREAHQSGTLRPAPKPTEDLAGIGEYAVEEAVEPTRNRYSQAESRYAQQIGKHPSELTAAERVLARMD